jgi:hypothetical protein
MDLPRGVGVAIRCSTKRFAARLTAEKAIGSDSVCGEKYMNDFIEAIERAGKAIQIFLDNLLNGIIEVCEKLYQWANVVFRSTVHFLIRFFIAMGRLIGGIFKIIPADLGDDRRGLHLVMPGEGPAPTTFSSPEQQSRGGGPFGHHDE